jgi:hypothetical protein
MVTDSMRMESKMKKTIKKVCYITGNIILVALLALAAYVHFKVAPYYTIDKSFTKQYELIFNATSTFSDYFIAADRYSMALRGFEQQDVMTDPNHVHVLSKTELKHNIQQASQQMDVALNKLTDKYGDQISPSIQTFLDWKKAHNPIDSINQSHDSWLDWYQAYSKQQEILFNKLRKLVGFYDITSERDAYIMSLVPAAEKRLMANPNDPELCQLSANYPSHDVPIKDKAKQIAFIKLGAKYCDHYYHLASSWGSSPAITKKQPVKTANRYEQLSYADYYKKEIYPLVGNVLSELKKDDGKLKYWCQRQGLSNLSSRDPTLDAMRAAYQLYGKKMCQPYDTPIEETEFQRTGISCIILISAMCDSPNGCDLIERCNTVAGASITD